MNCEKFDDTQCKAYSWSLYFLKEKQKEHLYLYNILIGAICGVMFVLMIHNGMYANKLLTLETIIFWLVINLAGSFLPPIAHSGILFDMGLRYEKYELYQEAKNSILIFTQTIIGFFIGTTITNVIYNFTT